MSNYPSEITLRAGVVPSESFGGFQKDLLERLQALALEDNINLNFETKDIQELYGDNLALISPDCNPGETVFVNEVLHYCSDYDMIVGDFWTNPE